MLLKQKKAVDLENHAYNIQEILGSQKLAPNILIIQRLEKRKNEMLTH